MALRSLRYITILTLFIFSCIYAELHAQASSGNERPDQVNIQNTNSGSKLDIHFNCDQVIQNLLVIVSDSIGQTIFLDTQYRFKGNYTRSIDLSNSPKGEYSVKVVRDDEKINKKIRMQ